jgi:hypothetical protein
MHRSILCLFLAVLLAVQGCTTPPVRHVAAPVRESDQPEVFNAPPPPKEAPPWWQSPAALYGGIALVAVLVVVAAATPAIGTALALK